MKSPKYSFFSEKGYILTKSFTPARTFLGLDKYASYKDFGEESWKIGYGSLELNGHALNSKDKATQEDIDKQYVMGVYICFGQNIHNADINKAIDFNTLKNFKDIHNRIEMAKDNKLLIFLSDSLEPMTMTSSISSVWLSWDTA